MDRRTFLKTGAFGFMAAGLSLAPTRKLFAAAPDVAVVKGSPAAAARGAVELLGGMGRFVKPGQKVLIKPNMSFARNVETGANTHPEVVKAILELCKEVGAGQVRVVDHALQNPEQSLVRSGILDVCEGVESGVCFQAMEERLYVESDFPQAVEMKKNAILREALEADVLIAVPAAKSHGGAGVSLSLKGQMGLIMDRGIMHWRYDLATAIVDLAERLKPALTVIDASRVMTTGGPGGPGKVITPGEVIASADPVAADALAVASYEWYGRKFEPRQVAYIAQAHERGLGRMDIENLNVARA